MTRLFMVVREDFAFLQHRLPVALAARKLGFEVHVLSSDNGFSSEIARLGFVSHGIPKNIRAICLFGPLVLIFFYIRMFWKIRPEVIHLSSTYVCLLGGIAALFAKRVPVIVSFTGLGFLFTSERRSWRMLLRLFRPAIAFTWNRPNVFPLFQNRDDANELRQAGFLNQQATLIPGAGVDISIFKPQPVKRADDTFVIGCAARLLKDKGIHLVVEAMEYVRPLAPQVVIRFAGTIDPFNPSSLTDSDIENWQNLAGIEFVGKQTDMASFWNRCDAAILASLREGMPKALLEAAASGLPLLASDAVGCRELVEHGKNGYLFSPSAPREIANTILKLASDPDFCRLAGKKSRLMILDRAMDEEAVAEGYTLFLKRITNNEHWNMKHC